MSENKRYSLDFEECDAIWIDDNVENKSYTIRNDTIKEKELEEIVDELNNLADENEHLIRKRGELETKNIILKGENEELKNKLENWKQLAIVAQSENSILHNELGIAIEQGYKLSDAYMEYKEGKEKEVVTDD